MVGPKVGSPPLLGLGSRPLLELVRAVHQVQPPIIDTFSAPRNDSVRDLISLACSAGSPLMASRKGLRSSVGLSESAFVNWFTSNHEGVNGKIPGYSTR